jgi:hypothetical protein
MPAAAPPPDPYALFARAQSVWRSQRYPEFVHYTIVVDVDEGGVEKMRHYTATYDAAHDRIYVDAVSEEEREAPHVPTGMEMTLEPKRNWMSLFKKHVGNPEEAVDYLGVPVLAPNYSFGIAPYVPDVATSEADRDALIASIRSQYHDPMSAEKEQQLDASDGLHQIGRVTSRDRDYDIVNKGVESVDGRDAYHLSLRPKHSPDRYRLRDIWIDAASGATLKLITAENFVNSNVPWQITFATVGGSQYIAREDALAGVGIGRHMYRRATITFESLAEGQPGRYLWSPPVASDKNVLSEPQR